MHLIKLKCNTGSINFFFFTTKNTFRCAKNNDRLHHFINSFLFNKSKFEGKKNIEVI
jgi:hypothetical protein